MDSLNYIAHIGLGFLPDRYEIKYALCEDMPEIYDNLSKDIAVAQICNGLGELTAEINQHGKGKKAKVSTEKDASAQRLILSWDGPCLSSDLIDRINASYQEGAKCLYMPSRCGTQIAGNWLNLAGGTIRIENFQDPPYTVRNVIELPLQRDLTDLLQHPEHE